MATISELLRRPRHHKAHMRDPPLQVLESPNQNVRPFLLAEPSHIQNHAFIFDPPSTPPGHATRRVGRKLFEIDAIVEDWNGNAVRAPVSLVPAETVFGNRQKRRKPPQGTAVPPEQRRFSPAMKDEVVERQKLFGAN